MLREKLGPWLPASFCAVLSLITVSGNLITQSITGTTDACSVVFYCFLPMCFYFAGAFLSQLRQENRELRTRLDELTSRLDSDNDAT